MIATSEERGPLAGERLIEYNIFLSDAFGSGPVDLSFFDDSAVPNQIDGFQNDDAYRASRHYALRQAAAANPSVNDSLRESSLARQLQDRRDQPATIRLIRRIRPNEAPGRDPTQGGRRLPWVDVIPPSTKFFLESVAENGEETVQITKPFGPWKAFFFPDWRPQVYTFSGTLLNAQNHAWVSEFVENYDYFLRGAQAVKYGATLFLQYADVMVEGYMLNYRLERNALTDKGVPFSFNVLVLNRSPLNPRNLLALRLARSGLSDAEQQLFQNMQSALDLLSGSAADQATKRDQLDTFLLMREFFAGNYVPPAGLGTSFGSSGTIEGQNQTAPGVIGGTAKQSDVLNPYEPTFTSRLDTGQLGGILGRDVTQDKTASLVGAGPPRVA